MKVSVNVVRQYIDFELPPIDELVARINSQLGGVEEVIDLNAKYKDAKLVKVVECEKHANADKLSVCRVDAGTGDLIQVVCGANNVHADMWAVWLPPESIVPSTYGSDDEFTLGARELRGVVSNGMLASARELDIGDDHDGIVAVTQDDIPEGKALHPGDSFAEIFGLNDTIIDVENKMFTHRPDLFGQLGVAREIAGIFGKQFTSPAWYMETPQFLSADDLPLEVFNDIPDKAPRLMAVAMKSITVKPSPLWLKCALVAMGGKPINNIVDATNYIMLITSQPVHAYDYDKIRGHRLGARMARDGEKLLLLNGKTYELTSDDIVIADGEGAIGLAGIMGGSNSEVTADTKNIVLEVANFNMYAVRKSSMRHGLFTDALTRFNKGQSPLQNSVVLAKLMGLIAGEQASNVFDPSHATVDGRQIAIADKFINDRLGLDLASDHIAQLLKNVEFKVEVDEKNLSIHEPFWRTDIDEPEDIVEEIGRLYGYDKLPRELPHRSTKPTAINAVRMLESRMRDAFVRAGANEVLTYSFVHERILAAAGQDSNDAYRLSNALSPDLQYYRLSITPSLLDKVHANIKTGHDEFVLFEIGTAHSKSAGLDDEGLPIEPIVAAGIYANKTSKQGAAFYQVKAQITFLMSQLATDVAYEPLSHASTSPVAAPFEPKRSAIIVDKTTGQYIGVIGEYKKTVARNFKLPEYAAGFELSLDTILSLVGRENDRYRPLSRFPSVERDISVKVNSQLSYAELYSALEESLQSTAIHATIVPIGIYQPEGADTKNVTFRLSLTSYDKTLTSEEGNTIVDAIVSHLEMSVRAERV